MARSGLKMGVRSPVDVVAPWFVPGRGLVGRWKPAFYLLEAAGFEVWLVNAKDVKHLPGRPKTDRLDAVWLCKVAERQMIRPSFVRPKPIRRLRDLTRYRVALVTEASAEKNRVEKLLEDAQIKLSVVASDIFGVSGRDMMAALIGGESDPQVLAQLARARMRLKIPQLEEAFVGHFDEHHAFLLAQMLDRIDAASAGIEKVDARIEAEIAPFADAVTRLDEIPGVGVTTARVIIAEIGVDMTRFPTPAHLASWARFAPASRSPPAATRAAARPGTATATWPVPSARPPRQPPRPTPSSANATDASPAAVAREAVVAVGRSILVIIWHLLSNPDTTFHDLGADYYENRNGTRAAIVSHVRRLQALGYRVTLEPVA